MTDKAGDEIIDKAFDAVTSDMKQRNIVTQKEFQKFQPLFDNSIRIDNTIDQTEIERLLEEFKARFIVNLPIIVTTNDGKSILEERPPWFLQIPSLNKHVPQSGELITAFDNIMTNPSQPIQKKMKISGVLHQALEHSINEDEGYRKNKERAMELTDKHDMKNEKKEEKITTEEPKSITEGMKWE